MSEKVEENGGVNCLYDKIIIKIEKDLEAPTVTMETNDNNVNFAETVHIKTEPETVPDSYDAQPCMFVRNIPDQMVDNSNDIKIGHIKVEKNDGVLDERSVGDLESGDHGDQYQNGIPADIETLRSSYLNEMISEESRNERRRLTKPKKFHEETMDSGDENENQAEPDSDWTPDSEHNIGFTYDVVWGQPHEFEKAVILATGEWLELTHQMNQLKKGRDALIQTSDTSPEQSPEKSPETTPDQAPEPQPKKRRFSAVLKPDAQIIAIDPPMPATSTPDTTTSTSDTPTSTPVLQIPPTGPRRAIPVWASTLHKKIDVMNKWFLSVEVAQQNTLKRLQALEDLTSKNNIQQQQLLTTMEKVMCLLQQSATPSVLQLPATPSVLQLPATPSVLQLPATPSVLVDLLSTPTTPITPIQSAFNFNFASQLATTCPPMDHLQHITHPNKLQPGNLQRLFRQTQANGPGNFAQHLVKALYPELFTEENLRTQYSYFGGGRLEKTALSPTRLDLVKQYVCIFYPEMQMKASFKDSVIGKINECLRRPTEQKKTVCRSLNDF